MGAGGNAGNSCAVAVITGLATKSIDPRLPHFLKVLYREIASGLLLAMSLFILSLIRVYFSVDHIEGQSMRLPLAISGSLCVIVMTSVVIGTMLPVVFFHCGLKPEHAGPAIQVIMDVLGVLITCSICNYMLMGDRSGANASAHDHFAFNSSFNTGLEPVVGSIFSTTSIISSASP